MTVCVAAIASSPTYPTIVAATDKLITAGDTTFDMRGGKRFSLGSRIVALTAGDSADGLAICRSALMKVTEGGTTSVEGVAELFAEAYREYRATIFERELLTPNRLTWEEFTDRRLELDTALVSCVDRYSREAYLPISRREFQCDAIIAGIDQESGLLPKYQITSRRTFT